MEYSWKAGSCVKKQLLSRKQEPLFSLSAGWNGGCTVPAGPSPTGWQAVTWHEAGSRPVVESFQNSSPHSGILQFFFLLPPLHVIFFPSHLQIKLTRAPGINGFLGLPPCSHPGPGPWFLTVICKPRRPRWKKLLYFLELLNHSLCKECVNLFMINSTYIWVPSRLWVCARY